jgi:GNAT superfamily N-acetyltransferase
MPWRPMTAQDLDRVQVLADAIHPDHPEGKDVFTERQRLYPEGCHVLAVEGCLVGYAIAHPWQLGEPPPLNSRLGAIPHEASTYYIHDVALLPEARGRGYASQIVERLAEHARGAGPHNLSLVAVNRSQMFWERLGFRAAAVPGLDGKLLSYGSDAVLMVRDLTKARD